MELKSGVVIVMGLDESGTPEFVYIQELLVDECNKVMLGVRAAQVVEYDSHFHSWVIEATTQRQLLPATNILSRQILIPRAMRNTSFIHKYVTLKFVVL